MQRCRTCIGTKPRRLRRLPPPKPFRIVFPEGFTRAQMAERVGVVARIAEHKGGKPRSALERRLPRGDATPRRPVLRSAVCRRSLEGFLFPATYDFLAKTTSAQLVARPDRRRSAATGGSSTSRYARSKNLTPYDVLTIASMVEKEAEAPAERPLIAAVIYNRLHERMPLGIDATLRYGLHIPPDESITAVAAAELEPVQHAQPARSAADADREPGPRLDAAPPRTRRRSTTSTSCASPTTCTTSSRRAPAEFDQYQCDARVRMLTHTSRCSAIRSPHSLSPRMQNAAFAAAGLDWHYSAFDVERSGRGRRMRCARSASPVRT